MGARGQQARDAGERSGAYSLGYLLAIWTLGYLLASAAATASEPPPAASRWPNPLQVLGGAGYVQDYPLEQLYRDQRLNMIHEGTAGIHAKTLVGRKLQGGGGRHLFEAMRRDVLAAEAQASISGAAARAVLVECAGALGCAVDRAEEVAAHLTRPEHKALALVNAHEALTMLGHTTAAWMWLRMATAAARGLQRGTEGEAAQAFYVGKLHTCTFFYRHELPRTQAMASLLLSLDGTVGEMQAGWF
jgi:hypothetical protein